jgi:N-acetyl-alpha-D-muramate 1-phosphate uridylyltransferase
MSAITNISEIPVAILAGGLAKRIRPLTETVPKSMLEINGRPFIDFQLELLHRKGLRKAVICLGHLGNKIEEHVGNGEKFGMNVTYSQDGEKLLGTGGAIVKALDQLGDRFFITYGDNLLDDDYQLMVQSDPEFATMMIYRNDNKFDQSNVVLDGNNVFYSKLSPEKHACYIDYGIALVNSKIFNEYKSRRQFDLAEVYEKLSREKKLKAAIASKRFYEIGSFLGLEEVKGIKF